MHRIFHNYCIGSDDKISMDKIVTDEVDELKEEKFSKLGFEKKDYHGLDGIV